MNYGEAVAAQAEGKHFWIELDERCDVVNWRALQREASSRGGVSLQQRVPVSPPL